MTARNLNLHALPFRTISVSQARPLLHAGRGAALHLLHNHRNQIAVSA
jgi:hypothetical protein